MINRLNSWLKKPLKYKILSWNIRFMRVCKFFMILFFRPLFRNLLKSEFGREIIYKSYPINTLLVSQKLNESYIVNSSDLAVGLSTFKREQVFEGSKFETALSLLQKGHKRSLFVDIGANIGSVGIHAVLKHQFNKCIAFEPDPSNYRLLKSNIVLNEVEDSFVPYNLALSDSNKTSLEFELSNDHHGDHRVRVSSDNGKYNESNRKVIKVNSGCLDDFSDGFSNNTTLIWIDTQGFEGHVLSGAQNVLDKQIPIVLEIWPYGLKRSKGFDILLDLFTKIKYRKMIDLEYPTVEMEFGRDNFEIIINRLNSKAVDSSTDILIY